MRVIYLEMKERIPSAINVENFLSTGSVFMSNRIKLKIVVVPGVAVKFPGYGSRNPGLYTRGGCPRMAIFSNLCVRLK